MESQIPLRQSFSVHGNHLYQFENQVIPKLMCKIASQNKTILLATRIVLVKAD
jgi:hypothetical protein